MYIPLTVVATRPFMGLSLLPSFMPKTEEIACTDDDCELDMFENHYTYDVPDDLSLADLQCPYCGGTDCLDPIEL